MKEGIMRGKQISVLRHHCFDRIESAESGEQARQQAPWTLYILAGTVSSA